MTAVNNEYYRFRLTFPEGEAFGTLWLIDERKLAFIGDWDQLRGLAAPTILALDADGLNEGSIRRAFAAFDPGYHLAEMKKPKLGHSQYHPRIHRQSNGPEPLSVYGNEFTSDIVAFSILERGLERLFAVLDPDAANGKAYGHEIRQVLILACTEAENLLKRALVANGYPTPKKNMWKTTDYVKLNPALRLDFYSSELIRYPDYPPIAPFHGWDPTKSTKSLDWYEAYNNTKHDRWVGMKEATFRRAIAAVAAVHVLLTAQFGFGLLMNRVGRFVMGTESGTSTVFKNSSAPTIPLEEQYIPWVDGGLGWVPVNHPF